jgi:hypothetical protein
MWNLSHIHTLFYPFYPALRVNTFLIQIAMNAQRFCETIQKYTCKIGAVYYLLYNNYADFISLVQRSIAADRVIKYNGIGRRVALCNSPIIKAKNKTKQ